MLKKITSIILTLVLVLSFSGCAQASHDPSTASASVEDSFQQADTDKKEDAPSTTPTPTQGTSTLEISGFNYVANKNTKKFHKPSCRYVDDIKSSNRWNYQGERAYLISRGYKPCKTCKP